MSQYIPENPAVESDLLQAYKTALQNDNLAINENNNTKAYDNSVVESIEDIYKKLYIEKMVAPYNDITRGEGVSMYNALVRSGWEDNGSGVSGASSLYNNPSKSVTLDGYVIFSKDTFLIYKRENGYSGIIVARLNDDYSFTVMQNIDVAQYSQIKSIVKIAGDKIAVFYNRNTAVSVKIYEVYDYELSQLSETTLLNYDYTEIYFTEIILNKVLVIYKDVQDSNNVKGFFIYVNQDDSVTKSKESVVFSDNNSIVYTNVSDGSKLYLKDLSISGNGTAITTIVGNYPCYVGNNKIVYQSIGSGKLTLKDLSIPGNGTAITTNIISFPCYVGNNKIVYVDGNGLGVFYLKDLSVSGNGTAITSHTGIRPCYVGNNKIVYANFDDVYKLYLKDLSIPGNGTAITIAAGLSPCYVGNNKIVYVGSSKLYLKDLSVPGDGDVITTDNSNSPRYIGNNKIIYTNNSDGNKLYLKDLSVSGNGTAITTAGGYDVCYIDNQYTIKQIKKINDYKTALLCETLYDVGFKSVNISFDINDNITVDTNETNLEIPTRLQDITTDKYLKLVYTDTTEAQIPELSIIEQDFTILSNTTLPNAVYSNFKLYSLINNKNILFYARSGSIYYRYLTRNNDNSITVGNETLLSAISDPYYIDFITKNIEGIFVFYNYNSNTIYNYKSVVKKNLTTDILGIALQNGKEDDFIKVQVAGICNIFKSTLIAGQKYYIDKFGNISTTNTGKFIGYALSSKDLLIINEAMLLKNDKGLLKSENLNDLSNKATARTNLDVYSKGEVDTKDNTKIAKTTYVETMDDTGIEDGMVVVFDKTNKKLKKLGNVKLSANDVKMLTGYSGNIFYCFGQDSGIIVRSNPLTVDIIGCKTSDYSNRAIYLRPSGIDRGLIVGSDGYIYTDSTYANTTANASNMYINSNGMLCRSTSSEKYKKDIEPIEKEYIDKILQIEGIWYRSLSENDNKEWSWFGISAEKLAEIEPRFVQWGYFEEDWEYVDKENISKNEKGEDVKQTTKERVLKKDAELKPVGVAYDRLVVPLIEKVKEQQKEIDDLKARLKKLESIMCK